ncbi:hypothetical protein OROGR_005627 [Orobanche gracilis]
MDSSPIPHPQSASTSANAAAPPPTGEAEENREERKELVHRTKVIQFLGRKAPIILQNDNGPCPLLAICNVLLLKNSLNLNLDISEVSQEKLLSLVAERLIDSNINIHNKDTGYVENQQQNIADVIDLLPRLTTGIDVNIKFKRVDDFEFTPECAIFDLLDIPLYHGWIVDPQDKKTADAIGSKSYNTLMEELVSLDTKSMESELERNPEDDSVDFVAATTAALGIPSPSLSRGQSFNESPNSARKGDIEEETELLRVLKLSETEKEKASSTQGVGADVNLHESAYVKKPELVMGFVTVEKTGTLMSDDCNSLEVRHINLKAAEVVSQIAIDRESNCSPTTYGESKKHGNIVVGSDGGIENGKLQPVSFGQDLTAFEYSQKSRGDEHAQNESTITSDPDEPINRQNACKAVADTNLFSGQMNHIHEHEAFPFSVDSSEPIYEGEECILDSGIVVYENREPGYEGEVVLAEQVDKGSTDDVGLSITDISVEQGEMIRNFLKNSATQLTVYGLFCLQDKVKERELCVFFRNNHFNTMFKYEGELYILATDQGFINQPDLTWEKLTEWCTNGDNIHDLDNVNVDTVYMTGSFKEFRMDDHFNSNWDEQNVMANTADYLASIDNVQKTSDVNLAIALQNRNLMSSSRSVMYIRQPPAAVQGWSLVLSVSHGSGKHKSSSKNESKSKEKCTIM